MKRNLPFAVLVLLAATAGSAMADQRCSVPLAEWQPREALQRKVEVDGWKLIRIKTDDGCYKAYASNDKGDRYEGKFDPATLKLMKFSIEYKEPR